MTLQVHLLVMIITTNPSEWVMNYPNTGNDWDGKPIQ